MSMVKSQSYITFQLSVFYTPTNDIPVTLTYVEVNTEICVSGVVIQPWGILMTKNGPV